MIYYSCNSNARIVVIFTLAVASLLTVQFISDVLPKAPSAFAIFGVYFFLFDKYLWRFKWLIIWHGIPDLNGKWEGEVVRKNQGDTEVRRVVARIEQTFHKIQVIFESNDTRSELLNANFLVESKNQKTLQYMYCVHPKIENNSENLRGDGCQILHIVDGSMQGPYYSSKFRGGQTTLKRAAN